MKKYSIAILLLAAVLLLCACTGTTPDTTGASGNSNAGASDTPIGYLFTYNGLEFGVDMPAADVLKALGTPKDKYTSKSCAFNGEDTVYYYSSIQVSTNNEQGYERIYSIYLEDDLVTTQKGICVGSTEAAVKEAYGEPGSKSSDAALIYEKDGMTLTFNLKDGKVTTIIYNLV